MNKDLISKNKKIIVYISLLLSVFVLGLVIGGSQNTANRSYKSKASEISNSVKVAAVKPNLVGKISSISSINDGKKTVIVKGISQEAYILSTKTKTSVKEKNYSLVVKPTTKIYKLTPKVTELTLEKLTSGMDVLVYATGDYVTALRIDIK